MDPSTRYSKRIIILGGWSPGPLPYLERAITSWQNRHHSHHVQIIATQHLSMPPIPGRCCCHPAVIVMFGIWIGSLYLAVSSHITLASLGWTVVIRLLLVVFACLWIRIIASVVVRVSLEQCIETACKEMYQGDDLEQVLLIGFSWGGAVLAEMLARGTIGKQGQPHAVLIAPTSSVVASIAWQKDAPLRMRQNVTISRVNVVHGSYDATSFCPNQQRWQDIDGVTLHILPDNHVFCLSSSIRFLTQLIETFLETTTQRA